MQHISALVCTFLVTDVAEIGNLLCFVTYRNSSDKRPLLQTRTLTRYRMAATALYDSP
jgi:hypothetical protein